MLRERLLLLGLLVLLGLGCANNPDDNTLAYVVGGDADQGQQTIADYGCGACHTIPGVPGARATVGPPLTLWAERVYIAGTLPNRPENLVRWLMNPQDIEPGTAMPDLLVTEQDARDMSAYLYTLR